MLASLTACLGGATGISDGEPAVGTVNLVALSLFALFAFGGTAWWLRAKSNLILAALAASMAFGLHNVMIGHGTYYWGTFPSDQLNDRESFVLYAAQELAFVGAAGMFTVAASRKLGLWIAPVCWAVVVGIAFEVSYWLSHLFNLAMVSASDLAATEMWASRLAMAYAFILVFGRERKPKPRSADGAEMREAAQVAGSATTDEASSSVGGPAAE